jgi:hypothetical protein
MSEVDDALFGFGEVAAGEVVVVVDTVQRQFGYALNVPLATPHARMVVGSQLILPGVTTTVALKEQQALTQDWLSEPPQCAPAHMLEVLLFLTHVPPAFPRNSISWGF